MKIFAASFNRATNECISLLIKKLRDHDMLETSYVKADYILAVADRVETFDFVVKCFKENKKIIHLFAGEQSCWATHDEVWRSAMTLMSDIQLCVNSQAKNRAVHLCKVVDKKPNAYVVGNVYLDSLDIDINFEAPYPIKEYDVVLYNPVTRQTEKEVLEEIEEIKTHLLEREGNYIWIEPNGDKYSEIVKPYVTMKTLPRPKFLSLLQLCRHFITNSSCQYFEAPFVMDAKKIISIGKRNIARESRFTDMTIENASDNIIKILEDLK